MKVRSGEHILTVLWIGSLWTIGYIVAPTLFQVLEDRALAGMIAGRLFTIESYLGLVCGGVLLLLEFFNRPPGRWVTGRMGLLLAMLGLIVIGQFVLQPLMAELKLQGLSQSPEFARWHGIAAMLYLLNSLLGLIWVVWWRRDQGGWRVQDGSP